MRLVIFGLTVSSSWGNGHATLWRGLIRALAASGHHVTFFEKDVPWYAPHRDLTALPGGELVLYPSFEEVRARAVRALESADAALVTSYCPDALEATPLVLGSRVPVKGFYDLDTPVTLSRLERGEAVEYVGPDGLRGFDVVLSFTGGRALFALKEKLKADGRVLPLYGSVDPEVHYPVAPQPLFEGDFSYMGTFATDRQQALEALFLEPAGRLTAQKFMLGGSMYPQNFPWRKNTFYFPHVAPPDHPAFFCSSRLTLNITRGAMAAMGHCPSGRLFEAAACGVPLLTDTWEGLETFFRPGEELLVAKGTDDVVAALSLGQEELARIARAARERVLAEHTNARRAGELIDALTA